MSDTSANLTACRDGCGSAIPDAELEHSGWSFLPISRRWRCPACWRALEQANLTSAAHKTHQGDEPDAYP